MDDYTQVPEDEQGVGAPYTYSDSLVTCTYEFNPGVLPLPSDALPYVAGAQDSTIFFLDNIPEKWLPKAGGYVSAGNSRLFPRGLGHRVLSVSHANGMYAVTLTPATVDDIFKELDIKMTLGEYQVPDYFIDEDVSDTLYDDDGNVVDVIQPSAEARSNLPTHRGLRSFTRAAVEDDRFELAPDGHSVIDWRYVDAAMQTRGSDTRAEPEVKDTTAVIEHKFEGTIGLVTFSYEHREENQQVITSYYEENTKKKTSTQWSQSANKKTTTVKGGIQANIGLDPAEFGDVTVEEISGRKDRWARICNELKNTKKLKARKVSFNPKLHNIEIPFTIGPVPCAFVIKFEASISLTVGAFVNFEQQSTSSVWRTTIVRNGKKETKSKKLISEGEESFTASFIGSGGTEFNLRVAVGVMVGIRGSGVGVDFGLGLKGGTKFEWEPTVYSSYTEGVSDTRVTLEMSVYGDVEPFLDLFGENVWNGRATLFEKKFVDKAGHFAPIVDTKKTNGTHSYIYDNAQNATVHHRRKLCFTQLWQGWFEKKGTIRPVLRVYKGDYEDYDYDELKPVNSSAGKRDEYTATPKVVYEFEYDSKPGEVLHFVPALHVEDEEKTYELRYMEVSMGEEANDPVVLHMDAYQESVDEDNDYWQDRSWEWFDTYRITDVVRLENVSKIAEVGVYVSLQDARGVQQFKNLKVKLLESTNYDIPIRDGDYKFHLKLSIPASGRWHYMFPQTESMPIYPVITLRPYAIIWRGAERGDEEEKYSSKQFNLKYPYTNTHNYGNAIDVNM
ncbi:MAG: hypothetical protein IJT75_05085 [Bacteroidaceae bacterium]|nr:hypothetical protein [Bacteroidaceae bacterium]